MIYKYMWTNPLFYQITELSYTYYKDQVNANIAEGTKL